MPSGDTAVVLLVLGGALVFAGALIGPESKDVDLSTVVSHAGEESQPLLGT
jgi:hypothetical protein